MFQRKSIPCEIVFPMCNSKINLVHVNASIIPTDNTSHWIIMFVFVVNTRLEFIMGLILCPWHTRQISVSFQHFKAIFINITCLHSLRMKRFLYRLLITIVHTEFGWSVILCLQTIQKLCHVKGELSPLLMNY